MLETKGMRFPIDVILVCIRWYAAYPLSYRHLEEMMEERGEFVDRSLINRWPLRFCPCLRSISFLRLPQGLNRQLEAQRLHDFEQRR